MAHSRTISPPQTSPPRLNLPTDIPNLSAEDAAATTSPARGTEMRNFLQARLQKNRAPPLVHSWDFYHDRQDRSHHTSLTSVANAVAQRVGMNGLGENGSGEGSAGAEYEERLEHLAVIDDVRKFWNVFNNFDISRLALRDSVHLFHRGVKPLWEDARNTRGGSWTFRVPKQLAPSFWQEVCMLAIGEQLQSAVEEPSRTTFRDDICGLSLRLRFNSCLVQIWNRDGEHQAGIDKILGTVLDNLSHELTPREGSYYYKKHSEHAGFAAPVGSGSEAPSRPGTGASTGASIDAILSEAPKEGGS